jgi:Barstar (barnase inhibitor)
MTTRRDEITAIYQLVDAPDWAAPNLDALADVLRDLSWLPAGPVVLNWSPDPDLSHSDRADIQAVLRHAVAETADGPRPVHL